MSLHISLETPISSPSSSSPLSSSSSSSSPRLSPSPSPSLSPPLSDSESSSYETTPCISPRLHVDDKITYTSNDPLHIWQQQQQNKHDSTIDPYWESYLANTTLYTNLHQRHVHIQGDVDHVTMTEIIPTTIMDMLHDVTKNFQTTSDIMLLSTFNALLYRYTQQDTIVMARSTNLHQQHHINDFIPLRHDFIPGICFQTLVSEISNHIIHDNQHITSSTLSTLTTWFNKNIKSDENMNVVFQKSSHPINNTKHIPNQQLMFSYTEMASQIQLSITYSKDVFEHQFMVRFLKNFIVLLHNLLSEPTSPIHTIQYIDSTEQHQLLVNWNGSLESRPFQYGVHHLFQQQVERTPNAIALIFENINITYQTLNQKSNQLAWYLQSMGIVVGDRVGIYLHRTIESILAVLAVMKSGATYVPLDPTYPNERIKYISQDAQPKIIITVSALSSMIHTTNDEIQIISLDDPITQHPITQQPQTNLDTQLNHSPAIATLLYTSGSTGAPKGTMIQHTSIVNRIMWERHPIHEHDIFCHITSLNFIDSLWEIFSPLIRGLQLVLFTRECVSNLYTFGQSLSANHISRVLLPPSFLDRILSLDEITLSSYQHVRYWTNSGEAVSTEICQKFVKRLPNSIYINIYGTTEVWDATSYICNDYFHEGVTPLCRSIPAGKPLPNTQILILDKYQQLVPIGMSGELFIGGPGVAYGYYNRPDITSERFITISGSRYYCTGDLARYLPDGNIEYMGRKDFLIKIRGFRVEPGEIESVILQLSFIQECIVHDKIDPHGSKHLVVYYILKPNVEYPTCLDKYLRDYLKLHVPSYMVASYYVCLKSRPLTPNGKTDRNSLPLPNWHQSNVAYVAAQSPVEKEIEQLWKELLHYDDHEQISIEADFFTIGGTSITAMVMISRLSMELNIPLSTQDVVQHSTIKTLSMVIDEKLSTPISSRLVARQAIVPLRTSSSSHLNLFLFHPITGSLLCYQPLLEALEKEHISVNVYGFTADHFSTDELNEFQSIEQLSTCYTQYITDIQSEGTYYLLGYSFGGFVALEAASILLEKKDRRIGYIGMIDTPGCGKLPQQLEQEQEILEYLRIELDHYLDASRSINIFKKCQTLQNHYIAKPLNDIENVSYFLAHEHDSYSFPQDYHQPWKSILPSIEYISIMGNHRTMMNKENIVPVAKQLASHLH